MKKWILATLIAQALFFSAWGLSETTKLRQGEDQHGEFLLETAPVDPRDWLSGQYMALRLKISDASSMFPVDSIANQDAALLLEPQSSVTLHGQEFKIYGALQAQRPAPSPLPEAAPSQIWVRAKNGPNARLIFGIERYYFSEDRKDEMALIHSGQFYARVTVAPDGALKLLGLEKK